MEGERLQEEMRRLNSDAFRNQSESQSSSATVGRLQSQINGYKNDLELMLTQKSELEKVTKSQKQEVLDAEKKSQDFYEQLLSTKENF